MTRFKVDVIKKAQFLKYLSMNQMMFLCMWLCMFVCMHVCVYRTFLVVRSPPKLK